MLRTAIRARSHLLIRTGCVLVLALAPACGTTKSRLATEQLLVSDAVDHAISGIDFRSLAGEKVFFDTRYLVNVKGVGFVNSEYVISSLRQQMIAADVRLQEKPDDAEYVVEARVGTLGTDGNEIIYGIPANRGLSEAASLLPNAPALPAIPELSLARKESQFGAVKVAAYAYARKSGEPIWQSGVARAKTSSQDVWLFGAGPFQQGSIHQKTTFAGNEIHLPGARARSQIAGGPPVPFDQEFYFQNNKPPGTEEVQTVQHTEPVTKPAEPQLVEPLAPGTPLIPPLGPLLPIPAAGTAPVPGAPPAGANLPPPAKG